MRWSMIVNHGTHWYEICSYGVSDKRGNKFDFWIENEDGEGMSITSEQLFKVLDVFFKEQF